MKKKVLSILMAGAMVLSLAGTTTVFADSDSGEKKTINLFTLYNDTNADANAIYFQTAFADAQEYFVDKYELVHETCDVETYKTKIKAMIAADETPDIFYSWGAGFVKSFVDAGKVLNMNDYLDDEYTADMLEGGNDEFTFDNGVYGLTYNKWVGALYCNKALFDEYGLELPETFDDLLDVCAKFRENGIQPMVVGMSDRWPGQQYVNEFMVQLGGVDLYNSIAEGEESFDNEVVAKAADYTKQLIDANAFNDGALGLSRDDSEQLFFNKQAAMNFTGSWFSKTVTDTDIEDDVVAIPFPTVSDAKYTDEMFGGAIDGICVGADTEYPDECVEVVEYIAKRMAECDGGMTTWKLSDEYSKNAGALNTQILEWSGDVKKWGLAYDTLLTSDQATTWLDEVESLFNGDVDGSKFASDLASNLW